MNNIKIGVFRIFGNELERPINDNDVALQLHNNRRDALQETFNDENEIEVADWGQTNDERPHEYVQLIIGALLPALTNHIVLPAVKYLFEKIADKVVDTGMEKAVSWIIVKLKKKQEEKKIGEFHIRLPDGTEITIANPREGQKIKYSVNGQWQEIAINVS